MTAYSFFFNSNCITKIEVTNKDNIEDILFTEDMKSSIAFENGPNIKYNEMNIVIMINNAICSTF